MSKELKRAWKDLVIQINPEIELMLGAGLDTTPEIMNRDMTRFFNRVQRQVYGPRWASSPLDRPIAAIGFHEMIEGNHHVHLAASGPDRFFDRIATHGSRIWKATRRAGDFHVDSIRRIEGYSRYITKAARSPRSLEHVFIYRRADWSDL